MTHEEIEQARAYLRGETNPPPDFTGLARLGERLLAEVERLSARVGQSEGQQRSDFAKMLGWRKRALFAEDALRAANVTPTAPAVDSAPCSDSSEVRK